ncbi:MAG: DUF5722 domain-containing protein, partial [Eubacteriales bacterium]|nr:DUF5722 domain-containing protein [Eubacteriales bacterium]
MIGSPRYITNPEIKAPEKTTADHAVKGFIASTPVLAEAGVSLTALRVNLGELPVAAGDSIAYEYGGSTYHFSAGYVESMDRQLNDLYIAGVSPILVFTLDESGKNEQAAPLIHPGAVTRTLNDSYAFNTETAEGTAYLSAVSDFLVRRYTGRIAGITVGNAIDNAYLNYNMGKRTIAEFADSYCRAFRVVYNTARSADSGIRVYISIGSSWDKSMTTDPALSYCGRDLIDIIGEQLRREGNIPWHLAADPYDFGVISVDTLPSLCAYLRREGLLYENTSRRVLLLSASSDYYGDGRDARQLAAEYIAAFLTVSSDACAAVEGFIVRDNPDFAYDEFDFYKILRYIDTDRSSEYITFASGVLGI